MATTSKLVAGLGIDLNSADAGTPSIGLRRALGILLKQASPGVAQPGRMGTDHFLVKGSPSAMKYTIQSGGLVITRTGASGPYLVGMPASVEIDAPPSDGTNPRLDRIYALQPDPTFDGADVDVQFEVGVVSSPPAASPVLPALPDGAIELARKIVGAGSTNTQAGAAFTNLAPLSGLNVPDLDWNNIANRPRVPFAMAAGRASVTGNGKPFRDVTITFPEGAFTVAPIITRSDVASEGDSTFTVDLIARSATGATFRVIANNGRNFSGTYYVYWIAVQMRSGSAEG